VWYTQLYRRRTVRKLIQTSIILYRSRDSDGLRAGRPGFDSRIGKIFLLSTASSPTLGPTQLPIQWVPDTISPGGKAAWREAERVTPSSAEVKNGGTIRLHGMVLN
jgi:hypothetical protein